MAETKASFDFRPLMFALILGGIGALLNSFTYPFLPEVDLVFGNAAFVMVAMRLLPKYALLTMFIAVTPLYFAWGHPFGYLTFGLEAYVLARLRNRGWYVFFADLAYWLCLGMPLTIAIIWWREADFSLYYLFIGFKQGFNGLLYTSFAAVLMFMLDRRSYLSWQQQPTLKRTVKAQLTYAFVLITCLSLIVVSLTISRSLIVNSQNYVSKSLQDNANKSATLMQAHLSEHQSLIAMMAKWLSVTPKTQWQELLNTSQALHSGFITMLIAGADANISQASPEHLLAVVNQNGQLSVSHRDYFQKPMAGQDLYTSEVFQGQGFGMDMIIAISAPIKAAEQPSQSPIAIVEGSLDLNILSQMSMAKLGEQQTKLVLVDQNNKVIFASEELTLNPLDDFVFQDTSSSAAGKRLTLASAENTSFAYHSIELDNQWRIYALLDYQYILKQIENEYLLIFIILFGSLLMTTALANQISGRLTRPLNFINKQIGYHDHHIKHEFKPLYEQTGVEIEQLYDEIKRSRTALFDYQVQLEDKVAERTQALNKANQRLQALASVDGLTQVFNRRYLTEHFVVVRKACQRSEATMAVVMLDLDYFKKLNDSHGHQAGDDCLVATAKLMKQAFDRDTDIVARYGGEEFVIVAAEIDLDNLQQKLEQLRQSIAEQAFVNGHLQPFRVTISIGAVFGFADRFTELDSWLKGADQCLYQAKGAGRNQVVLESWIKKDELKATNP